MPTSNQPKALILHANGINRDHEAAEALAQAGAMPEIIHINRLREGDRRWDDYQLLCIPGGFSYADALGGGKLMALDLTHYFADQAYRFVESGKPVIGICNGFQALVKAGILPGKNSTAESVVKTTTSKSKGKSSAKLNAEPVVKATLTFNAEGRFECRWVYLQPASKKCLWTEGLSELIYCPVAHGEGRFVLENPRSLDVLKKHDQVALTYVFEDGTPANGVYPDNPNGSIGDIAGICNAKGNVLGLMPHPEDHIHAWQHPRHSRDESGRDSLAFFRNGVNYAKGM